MIAGPPKTRRRDVIAHPSVRYRAAGGSVSVCPWECCTNALLLLLLPPVLLLPLSVLLLLLSLLLAGCWNTMTDVVIVFFWQFADPAGTNEDRILSV